MPGADDRDLLELVTLHRPEKFAIDAPFSWPEPFVISVTSFTESGRWPADVART